MSDDEIYALDYHNEQVLDMVREKFERWVRSYAPTAEFTRAEDGEYIVLGMQDKYLAFCEGSKS